MLTQTDAKVRERFNFEFPALNELMKKTALVLINTDSAIDFPEPLGPNMIPVGGLQISAVQELPAVSKSSSFIETRFDWFFLGNEKLHRQFKERNDTDVAWNEHAVEHAR